jgi:hypothetical protein
MQNRRNNLIDVFIQPDPFSSHEYFPTRRSIIIRGRLLRRHANGA